MRHACQTLISNQIRDGKRLPASSFKCVDCDNDAQEYDHYLGHEPEHTEDVEPVCKSCHRKREIIRGANSTTPAWLARTKPCPHGQISQRRCTICRRECVRLASAKYRKLKAGVV